jgi:hypothetical protein
MRFSVDVLAGSVRQCNQQLLDIVEAVCGACGKTCCHQGTMMGSTDLRRLYKGILFDPLARARLESGLQERGAEMRVEQEAIEQIVGILERSQGTDRQSDLAVLRERLTEWRLFCDRLQSGEELTLDGLTFLLRFSAIRANVLRVLREFPGALEALASHVSLQGLHTGRGRMAPPSCLFLGAGGCLAGDWKPAKCANFYCAGQPNLLAEIAREMSFEEFVRANFRALTPDETLRYLELELFLGREFVEPKIVLQPNTALRQALDKALSISFTVVEHRKEPGAFMWSTAEVHARLGALPEGVAYVVETGEVSGEALYELAVALDRLRVEQTPPAFYLLAESLTIRSFFPHPLWTDQIMTQPLGFLDLIAVDIAADEA